MVEQVFRRHEVAHIIKAVVAAAASLALLPSLEGFSTAHLVVLTAFGGVRKTSHRSIDFFKSVRGLRSGVLVGVNLERSPFKGFLEVVISGCPFHT